MLLKNLFMESGFPYPSTTSPSCSIAHQVLSKQINAIQFALISNGNAINTVL